MDYKKIYDNLVQNRIDNPLPEDVYKENHHIVPKCMGGSDDKSNIVALSAREHFLAHKLLYKIHKTSKLSHAWFSMFRVSDGQPRNTNSRDYEICKKIRSKHLSEDMRGKGNPFYDKKHSEKTKKRISEANSGRTLTQEQIDNWVKKVASKTKSKEHRRKIGRKGLVMLKHVETGECVRVPRDQSEIYDKSVWKNPAAIRQKTIVCSYCGKESTVGNINRWHNENCKHRPNNK